MRPFAYPYTEIAALIAAHNCTSVCVTVSLEVDCTICSLLCSSPCPWQLSPTESSSALLLHLPSLLRSRMLMKLCRTGNMNMKTAIICLCLLALVGTSMGALDALQSVKKVSEIQGLDQTGTPSQLTTLLFPDCWWQASNLTAQRHWPSAQ